jgi:hypothetical protein
MSGRSRGPARRSFLRDNSLSLFFLALFLAALVGHALAGHQLYNQEQQEHGEPTVGFLRFVTSSRFAVEVSENWQSEFLQFTLYILATIWFVQRGSSESKLPGREGLGSDEDTLLGRHARPRAPRWARAGGVRTRLFSHSLTATMAIVFVASWLVQSISGWRDFNQEQAQHGGGEISWGGYLIEADFWDRTLQNWQSEFLAVGTMVIFAVFLRQRGSPESKPVGMAHEETGSED